MTCGMDLSAQGENTARALLHDLKATESVSGFEVNPRARDVVDVEATLASGEVVTLWANVGPARQALVMFRKYVIEGVALDDLASLLAALAQGRYELQGSGRSSRVVVDSPPYVGFAS